MLKQFEPRREQKKRGGCLIIFIIILLLILAGAGFIGFKYGSQISKLFSYITHSNTKNTVATKTSFTIKGNLYFVKDKNLYAASGSSISQITHDGKVDQATISQDGTFAIVTQIDDNFSLIYRLDLDTLIKSPIIQNKFNSDLYSNIWNIDPVLSSDNTKMMYLTDKGKFASGISDLSLYQFDMKTLQSKQISQGNPYTGGDQDPVYDPLNSNYVVYNKYIYTEGDPQPYSKLYLMDILNRQSYQLSPDYSGTLQPSFSPDGNYIIFTQRTKKDGIDDKEVNTYIMPFSLSHLSEKNPNTGFNIDYTNKVLVHEGLDSMPVFSPDMNHIAFITNTDHGFNLAMMDLSIQAKTDGTTGINSSHLNYITSDGLNATSRISWSN